MFANKIKVTNNKIEEAFKLFVKENAYDAENSLYIFDLCSMYGIELDDSTIDRIRINSYGEIEFVYNENENDYDNIKHFSYKSLKKFYNEIVDAWNEEIVGIDCETAGMIKW